MHSTALSLALAPPVARRILLLDRNPVNRRALRAAVESQFQNLAITECDNATAAKLLVERGSIDAVLLDATSPDWRALSDAGGFRASPSPAFVVITSMEHLATAIGEFSAVDYVVRPFSADRLALAMQRAFARADERPASTGSQSSADVIRPIRADVRSEPQLSDVVLLAAGASAYRRRFLVGIGTRDVVVHADDLAWVRASGYCATLVLRDRREYLVRLPLDQLEIELDPDEFIRIHRSAIVRFQELQELERSASRSVRAVLRSGTRIPVSRSRRDALIRALGGA